MKNKKLFAILTLVCFMFTLMPVAAFAAGPADTSYLYVNSATLTTSIKPYVSGAVTVNQNAVKLTYDSRDNGNAEAISTGSLYIWATENGNVVSALDVENVPAGTGVFEYAEVKAFDAETATKFDFNATFKRPGTFKVHAAFAATTPTSYKDLTELVGSGEITVNVLGSAANPDDYRMTVNAGTAGTATDAFDWKISSVTPNNVANMYTLSFLNTQTGRDVINKTVTMEADSSNITVTPLAQKTNYLGELKFQLSAAREGNYTIYVTVDGVTFVIAVECTNTSAAYIETVAQPTAPIALFTTGDAFRTAEKVVFEITDINGNSVLNAAAATGADGLYGQNAKVKAQYLAFTQKPAATTLTNADLSIDLTSVDGEYVLKVSGTFDAEGIYAVKAILDNGAVATAKWEVKKFETPVKILITAPSVVELGDDFTPVLNYVDVNGVTKPVGATAKLAATGYAIEGTTDLDRNNTIYVKSDEKYAGSVIKLTAVSEMYDLVATYDVKVAAEAVAIEFESAELEVDVNNKVEWNVVDENGKAVKLQAGDVEYIKYVVLEKPADAKVSVYDLTGTSFDGDGEMAITSNKVGIVKVQVIAQINIAAASGDKQTKYYTGVGEFAIGMDNFEDVVVMSIGSKQIVINSDVKEMLCEAVIKDGRTFVPFRAGLEALGATVDYDKTTQSVIAEMNGVKVIMTLGEKAYTVNGVAKVADVAPYLNVEASTTMVPARFVADAFGINYDYTTNPDGTVADVIFAN